MTARDACAHCSVPRGQHGRRYAAIPGWHDWQSDRTPLIRYATGGWIVPVGTVFRNDTGAPIAVQSAPAPSGVLADNTHQET